VPGQRTAYRLALAFLNFVAGVNMCGRESEERRRRGAALIKGYAALRSCSVRLK
jgi:hypothetical protein